MSDNGSHPEEQTHPPGEITRLMQSAADGVSDARERLLPIVYHELLAIARRRMAGERRSHTLQATALVHEVYLRLLGGADATPEWRGRAQFFRAAADAMRNILIDHARARGRQKRGGERQRVPLDGVDVADEPNRDDIVALDAAICRLQERDARAAEIVRLRYYGGLNVEDTAMVLELSPRTVKREWAFARAWLFSELNS